MNNELVLIRPIGYNDARFSSRNYLFMGNGQLNV